MSVARFGRQKKENELPEIRAYAPGIYTRSEELVQATLFDTSFDTNPAQRRET